MDKSHIILAIVVGLVVIAGVVVAIITLSGGLIGGASGDLPMCAGGSRATLLGDINGNGRITDLDKDLLRQLNNKEISISEYPCADTDRDGVYTINDVQLLTNCVNNFLLNGRMCDAWPDR